MTYQDLVLKIDQNICSVTIQILQQDERLRCNIDKQFNIYEDKNIIIKSYNEPALYQHDKYILYIRGLRKEKEYGVINLYFNNEIEAAEFVVNLKKAVDELNVIYREKYRKEELDQPQIKEEFIKNTVECDGCLKEVEADESIILCNSCYNSLLPRLTKDEIALIRASVINYTNNLVNKLVNKLSIEEN